jgi:hypothetical protein
MEQQPNEINQGAAAARRGAAKRVRVRMTSDVLIVDDQPEVRDAIAAIRATKDMRCATPAMAAPRSRRSTPGHPA